MTHLVDTNILLRLFLRDEVEQTKKAERTIEALLIENHTLFIDPLVISEFLFVSMGKKYNVSKEQCINFLSTLFEHEQIITINKAHFLYSLDLFKNKTIDFVDCYLAARAKTDSVKVLSFDRHFDKLAPSIRVAPHE